MKKTGSSNRAQLALLVTLVGLAFVAFFQRNALEKRMIAQEQQLRSFGESTERFSAGLKRLQSGVNLAAPSAGSGDCQIDKILHPEAPNLLEPRDKHWPAKGAYMEGKLTRGWRSGDPKSFNPLTENAAELGELIETYVNNSLAARNRWTAPGKWHGELACRIEATNDNKEYTIYLRRGVFWHEPEVLELNSSQYSWLKGQHELTAHDFVFMLDLMMDPKVENGFVKGIFGDLESWKALDDYTLQVKWKKKAYFSAGLTMGLAPIPKHIFAFDEAGKEIPEETLGLRFNQHWFARKGYLGVGAYRMTEYSPGQRIVLQRNERFFGERPAVKDIVYPIYTDYEQSLLRLKSGELTVGELRPSHYRQEILPWKSKPKSEWPKDSPFASGEVNCRAYDAPVYRYLGWNADRPLFADVKVRTAMTLALNRQAIVDNVFVGLGQVATGPFLPATGYNDPDVDPLKFDLKRAGRLLDEAGWVDTDNDGLRDKVVAGNRTRFEFTLLIYGSSPEYTALANIFKEDLLKIGVKLNITSAEWSLMLKKMEDKEFDAYTGAWVSSWESDPYQIWHSSQADAAKGSNRVGFRDKRADELIETLRSTFDPEERKSMHRELHRIIYKSQNYTFLLNQRKVHCMRASLANSEFAKARPLVDTRPWAMRAVN